MPHFPLAPCTTRKSAQIVQKWTDVTLAVAIAKSLCATCAQLVSTNTLVLLPLDDPGFEALFGRANDILPAQFWTEPLRLLCLSAVDYEKNVAWLCQTCSHLVHVKKEVPFLSLANGLWLRDVLPELQDLCLMKKIIIACYWHNICIVTVSTEAKCMQGNAVVFLQPVMQFQAKLPLLHADLSEVVAIIFIGPCKPTEDEFKRTPMLICKYCVL